MRRPPRSTVTVFGPASARISCEEPTATILSPDMASASADGRASSAVQILPFTKMRSARGAGACASATKGTQSNAPNNLVCQGALEPRAFLHSLTLDSPRTIFSIDPVAFAHEIVGSGTNARRQARHELINLCFGHHQRR